ncbi:tachykinin-3b [Scomber scombrus]|uniref:Tachykinin-3b n=1 Tax=Scomber scombrus TaxID=13677 RepID=A0AAV1N932_SCOSC
MERIPNCCSFASLVALVILVSFPVRSWCEEGVFKPQTEAKPECAVREDAELKRFDDDYDNFVGLMGRRNAPQPIRDLDHIFADLMGRKMRFSAFCRGDVTPRLISNADYQSFSFSQC